MKSAKRLSALALALAMCGTLLAGCGPKNQNQGSGDEGAGSGHPGVLNVHIETNVQSMDPQEATDGTSFEVIANITDGLTQPDANGAAVAAMAESWETSEDQLTWSPQKTLFIPGSVLSAPRSLLSIPTCCPISARS